MGVDGVADDPDENPKGFGGVPDVVPKTVAPVFDAVPKALTMGFDPEPKTEVDPAPKAPEGDAPKGEDADPNTLPLLVPNVAGADGLSLSLVNPNRLAVVDPVLVSGLGTPKNGVGADEVFVDEEPNADVVVEEGAAPNAKVPVVAPDADANPLDPKAD